MKLSPTVKALLAMLIWEGHGLPDYIFRLPLSGIRETTDDLGTPGKLGLSRMK